MRIPEKTKPVSRNLKTMQSLKAGGVTPSIPWWCLAKCAGGAALKCIPKCGTNIACYATCAPQAIGCITACFS